MTPPARRSLTMAGVAAIFGVGLGIALADVAPVLSLAWGGIVAIVTGSVLVALVLATTWPAAPAATADETAWSEFRRELRRSRRNGRPLTLVRIPMSDPESADALDATALSTRIGAELRLIDRSWVDGDSIYVMLPESSRSAGRVVVDRLAIGSSAALETQMATFPDDGLTSGALLAALNGAATGEVPIPLRPSFDDVLTLGAEVDATLGGATGPR
jgi:hypothetical protein